MKFIHTSDLHIDQPFSGINTDNETVKQLVNQANETVLTRLVDQCINEAVDFLLIVGDTFHQAVSSIRIQAILIEQFNRLNDQGITVVLSFGNHDYYSPTRYWFEWPENVLLFTEEAVETKILPLKNGETVAISGFSYQHQWITDYKALEFPERNTQATYHIGFYHGQVGKDGNYAPFTISDLTPSYDYWALGHIHKSDVIREHPATIYPGTPQGHQRKETQGKGVVSVTLKNGQVDYEWHQLAPIVWDNIMIDVETIKDRQELLKVVLDYLTTVPVDSDLLVINLALQCGKSDYLLDLQQDQREITDYLQQELLTLTDQKKYLTQVSLTESFSDDLVMGFEADLIDDLSRKFYDMSEFKRIGSDILQNSVIASRLEWDEHDVTECIARSTQLIKDKIRFKSEVVQ
ncbi:hypothetical protein CBF34_06625 [Vagococcus penaei]|uniref:Uncharacterized protein n=1 Tax=Vagococcus penaei TaxID=633807 RepID=A0A1Q2D6V3_9ENTE|nr:DNA repair exonuclease [Vagococcus penaei]AQP54043.1 hypothetical protein BW732_07320 [Vagococcus penaei]RSU01724.1 hypothetical protein CBF34_06625 [Vagococcus penaei]